MRWLTSLAVAVVAGCAHVPLSKASLDETRSVALVARIPEQAGPNAWVFRRDGSYQSRLDERHIDSTEGDRRLALVLARGSFQKDADGSRRLIARTVTRFELAESLRSELLGRLPRRAPWTTAVSPVEVARVLESFLVKEDASTAPEYGRLVSLGADTVVEVAIEDYGLRSQGGRAGAYLVGTARMFRIGGPELYHRRFSADDLDAEQPPLDPFSVAKDADQFGRRLKALIRGVVELLAADLSPASG